MKTLNALVEDKVSGEKTSTTQDLHKAHKNGTKPNTIDPGRSRGKSYVGRSCVVGGLMSGGLVLKHPT